MSGEKNIFKQRSHIEITQLTLSKLQTVRRTRKPIMASRHQLGTIMQLWETKGEQGALWKFQTYLSWSWVGNGGIHTEMEAMKKVRLQGRRLRSLPGWGVVKHLEERGTVVAKSWWRATEVTRWKEKSKIAYIWFKMQPCPSRWVLMH